MTEKKVHFVEMQNMQTSSQQDDDVDRISVVSSDSEDEAAFERLLDAIEDKNERQMTVRSEAINKDNGVIVPEMMLYTNPELGLTEQEALKRRRTFGENDLSEHKPHLLRKFMGYFTGPIQYAMIIALALAFYLSLWIDIGVIVALLLINAIVGFLQEYQAGNVVDALKNSVELKAVVIRDSVKREIPARQVVPGDIVFLDEGTVVPADGKIVDHSGYMQIDQSALTGESLPVEKRFSDIVFSGTLVRRGEATIVVTAIGDHTFMGKTASLTSSTKTEGHFTKVLADIGTIQLVLVVLSLFIIWIVGVFRDLPIDTLLTYTFIIIVIGVPVGLPAVVTTTMAVGAAELAAKRVIVQKLAAIETLAGVDILCSDKTGTLTQNKLTVDVPFCLEGVTPEDILSTGALASSKKLKGLDAIDKAVLQTLRKFPLARENLRHYVIKEYQPFDPVSKKVTAVVENQRTQTSMVCLKGAPNAVLNHVKNADEGYSTSAEEIERYTKQVEDLAARGYRSLGIARKQNGAPWELLGIIPLFDPPRYDTASTVTDAKELGLDIKMLTGDAVGIAKETARQLNLGTKIYNVKQLISFNGDAAKSTSTSAQSTTNGTMSGSKMTDFVVNADGFAEVFPQHKYMVVEILQRRGHIVAMTGDGVNDAPSLKRADVGIAVEGASQAARTAADIVFLNAGLNAIIEALKTSRRIFHRMRAYVIYRIALSIHLEIFLVITIVFFRFTISDKLIVFLAIFADIATLAIAYDNASYSQKPTKWDLRDLWIISTIIGIILAVGSLIMYLAFRSTVDPQQVLLLNVALTQNWLIFITRVDGPFWISFPSWHLLLAVFAVDVVATLFAVFALFTGQRLSAVIIIEIWLCSFGIFAVMAVAYVILIKMSQHFAKGPERLHRLEDLWFILEREAYLHEKYGKKSVNWNGNGKNGRVVDSIDENL